jgi:protein-disulfide isomerase
MARRKAQQQRAAQRQAARRRYLMIGLAVVAVIVVIGVLLVASGRLRIGPAPSVAQERLDTDPILGAADAPVTIIEYGAYGCSACASWHNSGAVESIIAAYPDQVRFVYRDLPIIAPTYDQMAAELAQCALDQDADGFWDYHDALFSRAGSGTALETLVSYGASVGLDGDALRACYVAGTHRATVDYDLQRARDLGLTSTPSFFVNDQYIPNASPELIRAAVESALSS